MSWNWRLEGADGASMFAPTPPSHPSQSDAESWLGEQWQDLREQGVVQVTLFDGDTKLYGPMPLADA